MNGLQTNKAYSDLLEEKYVNRKELVNELSEIMDMDRKSVYRRLNNEVYFTFSEICKISYSLGISLDKFISNHYSPITSNLPTGAISNEEGLSLVLENVYNIKTYISDIASQPYSEMGNLCNNFPVIFYLRSKELIYFHEFYKNYRYGYSKSYQEYKENPFNQKVVDAMYDLSQEYIKLKSYELILGNFPVRILMLDLNYLRNINLMTEEDIIKIKKEASKIIDKLEYLTNKGFDEEYGSKYNIYISQTAITINYYYLWSEAYWFSSIQSDALGDNCSVDLETLMRMKRWFNSMKNSSILITGCSKNERIRYMDAQRRELELT